MVAKKDAKLTLRLTDELLNRIKKQSEKEGRTQTAFIIRVLDRYLLKQEFRGDVSPEVAASIKKNKELLQLLKNA